MHHTRVVAIEDDYDGPRLEKGSVTLSFMQALMEHYKEQKRLHRKYAYQVNVAFGTIDSLYLYGMRKQHPLFVNPALTSAHITIFHFADSHRRESDFRRTTQHGRRRHSTGPSSLMRRRTAQYGRHC